MGGVDGEGRGLGRGEEGVGGRRMSFRVEGEGGGELGEWGKRCGVGRAGSIH